MKVFISWSGPTSRETADILRRMLPCMIQGLNVFLSRHDLESGARWGVQLAKELEETGFGILCLTEANQATPWVLYEAGALTKQLDGRACGLLLGKLRPANVSGPLAQFQHRHMTKEDFKKLLRDLNTGLPTPLEQNQLTLILEKWWPDLEEQYSAVLANAKHLAPAGEERSDRELLEEVLERIRKSNLFGQVSPNRDANKRLIWADALVRHLVSCLPDDQYQLLTTVCTLKRGQDDAGVDAIMNKCAAAADALLSAGYVTRDKDNAWRVNRLLSRVILVAKDNA